MEHTIPEDLKARHEEVCYLIREYTNCEPEEEVRILIERIAKLTADRDALLKALEEALCWFGNGCSAAAAGAQCDTMYEAQEQGKAYIAQAKEQP